MSKFKNVKINRPKSSHFDLSHEKKMTFNLGELIPSFMEEVVPGDEFTVNSEILLRMAPLQSPLMHRLDVFTHFFFVPYRLLWEDWEDFITGGPDGTADPGFPTSVIASSNYHHYGKGTLGDYLGMPIIGDPNSGIEINMLPFRAYQTIYNEYYRDQNLTEPVDVKKTTDVSDVEDIRILRKRAWEKDYFTSALPWAQRGAGSQAQVSWTYKDQSTVLASVGSPASGQLSAQSGELESAVDGDARIQNLEDYGQLDINNLRTAIKVQKWLETNARGGARYVEQILAHFGVKSKDARLQRPEYLGGGRQPISISEVLNTSSTATEEQGNMSGHGISVGRSNRFKKYFTEHGIVMGIISAIPKTTYQNGLPRLFSKFDRFDYAWPQFAQLGEQEIKLKEIWLNGGDADDAEQTWGYQERYAEYKYKPSTVHGEFKDTLDFWHAGRQFSSKPSLNTSFIECDEASLRRLWPVEDSTDKLYCQIYHRFKARRPLPYYNVPDML